VIPVWALAIPLGVLLVVMVIAGFTRLILYVGEKEEKR